MATSTRQAFEFGAFRLDPAERILLRHGEPVALTPKVFDTLVFLVENAGRLITKDEFMKEVWADAFVEDAALAQSIIKQGAFNEKPEHAGIKRDMKVIWTSRCNEEPTCCTELSTGVLKPLTNGNIDRYFPVGFGVRLETRLRAATPDSRSVL
jgi:hypothetical protein